MDDTVKLWEGQQALRSAWSDLLSRYTWDSFGTHTWNRSRRDTFEAVKCWRIWLQRGMENEAVKRGLMVLVEKPRYDGCGRQVGVDRQRYGKFWRGWRRGDHAYLPVYVLGVERHRSGDVHLHSLIKYPPAMPDCSRRDLWSLWYRPVPDGGLGLGRNRIEPPTVQADVNEYISKYVTKGGDLVISDSFASMGRGLPLATPLALAVS